LIGIPYRIIIGKKLSSGMVELVERPTHRSTDVPVGEAAAAVAARIANA
jgi:prolyl-tRNA synthetase